MTNATIKAPVSVPLPSADLITYRFDQVDKQLTHFEGKLDSIVNSFATKEELGNAIKDIENLESSMKGLTATDNRQQGSIDANRRMLTISLTVLGIAAGALATYIGLHGK